MSKDPGKRRVVTRFELIPVKFCVETTSPVRPASESVAGSQARSSGLTIVVARKQPDPEKIV